MDALTLLSHVASAKAPLAADSDEHLMAAVRAELLRRRASSHYLFKLYALLVFGSLQTSEIGPTMAVLRDIRDTMRAHSARLSMNSLRCPFGSRGSNKSNQRIRWELCYRMAATMHYGVDFLQFRGQMVISVIFESMTNIQAVQLMCENLQKMSACWDDDFVRGAFRDFEETVLLEPHNVARLRHTYHQAVHEVLLKDPLYKECATVDVRKNNMRLCRNKTGVSMASNLDMTPSARRSRPMIQATKERLKVQHVVRLKPVQLRVSEFF